MAAAADDVKVSLEADEVHGPMAAAANDVKLSLEAYEVHGRGRRRC